MTELSTALIQFIWAMALISVFHTFQKEKIAISEGGDPLATSSYVMLVLQYLLWMAVVYGISFLDIVVTGMFVPIYVIVTYIIGYILLIIVRTIIVQVRYRSIMRKKGQDKAG